MLSVTAALVAFGLSIERLGLVLAILLLTGIGALATKHAAACWKPRSRRLA